MMAMLLVRSAPGVSCTSMRLMVVVGVTDWTLASTGAPETTVVCEVPATREFEVENRTRLGAYGDGLLLLRKILSRHGDGVIADGNGVEFKFAVVVGLLGLGIIGIVSFQRDLSIWDGAMLRVVDDAANAAEDCGVGGVGRGECE